MQTKWYNSASDIDTTNWNNLPDDLSFFHRTDFLNCIEDSRIQNSKLYYFCVTDGNKLVASAVISFFTMEIDLFMPNHSFVHIIKRRFPDFFKIKLLFCGTPISIGQSNLFFDAQTKATATYVLNEIESKMQEIAKTNKIQFYAYKEFDNSNAQFYAPLLKEHGYFKAYSLPTVDLHLHFSDSTAYWKDLSANKRRQIKQALQKIDMDFLSLSFNKKNTRGFAFSIQNCAAKDAKTFYEGYASVMKRAQIKFETLNQKFFSSFFALANDQAKILRLTKDDQLLAGFLFIEHHESISFIWVSRQQPKDEYDSYFNLMSALTKYALLKGKKLVRLGQTAYYTKMRMGGTVKELYLFFKCRNRFMHLLFKIFNSIIFPKIKIPYSK